MDVPTKLMPLNERLLIPEAKTGKWAAVFCPWRTKRFEPGGLVMELRQACSDVCIIALLSEEYEDMEHVLHVTDFAVCKSDAADRVRQTTELALAKAARMRILRLQARLDGMRGISSSLAHQFENALGGMMMGLELISKKTRPGEEIHELNRGVIELVSRGRLLVQNLSVFSGNLASVVSVVQPGNLVDMALSDTCDGLGDDYEVVSNFQRDMPGIVTDGSQMRRCLDAVLKNAIEAMPDGGALRVEAGVFNADTQFCASRPGIRPGRYVRFCVSDTGCGMEPDILPRVFEPFFSTKSGESRFGLGLSMVYGFVRSSGGSVEIESIPDKGTTVEMLLPAQREPSRPAMVVSSPEASAKATILVVDDELDIRNMLGKALQGLGYKVLLAEDGNGAVELFEEHDRSIDLVIMDFLLPGLNGLDACAMLRERAPDLKVVLITGYGIRENSEEIKRLKIDNVIRKPFRVPHLVSTICRCLGHTT